MKNNTRGKVVHISRRHIFNKKDTVLLNIVLFKVTFQNQTLLFAVDFSGIGILYAENRLYIKQCRNINLLQQITLKCENCTNNSQPCT